MRVCFSLILPPPPQWWNGHYTVPDVPAETKPKYQNNLTAPVCASDSFLPVLAKPDKRWKTLFYINEIYSEYSAHRPGQCTVQREVNRIKTGLVNIVLFVNCDKRQRCDSTHRQSASDATRGPVVTPRHRHREPLSRSLKEPWRRGAVIAPPASSSRYTHTSPTAALRQPPPASMLGLWSVSVHPPTPPTDYITHCVATRPRRRQVVAFFKVRERFLEFVLPWRNFFGVFTF